MADYISDLKLSLDITWEMTEDEESKLAGEARRAESFLSKRAGETLEFSIEDDDQSLIQLIFDCVRYIRANALDEFENNYFDDLQMLRMNVQAKEDDEDGD